MTASTFFTADTGAVTVDWVVLTAALVGLGLATMAVVSSGVEDTSGDINHALTRNHIVASFTPTAAAWPNSAPAQGATPQAWGYDQNGLEGWETDGVVQMIRPSHLGIPSDADYLIDMRSGSAHDLSISTPIQNLRSGETVTLSFDMGTYSGGGNVGLEVWYGGQLIDTIQPGVDRTMQNYTYELTGGTGDGSDVVRFTNLDIGTAHSVGALLGDVTIE